MRTFAVLALVLSVSAAFGQKSPYEEDTRALTAAGKLENRIYSNQHAGFAVRLPLTPCIPQLNTKTDLQKGSATLLECVHDVDGGGAYTFSLVVDSWTRYGLVSVEQYVRGLQRLGETAPKDRSKLDPNSKTIEPQTPRTWAGLDFRELIMSISDDGTVTDYAGVSCTHLKSYVLCFQAHAGSVEMVRALLKLDHKLEIAPMKPPGPSASRSGTLTMATIARFLGWAYQADTDTANDDRTVVTRAITKP
jgi:hypothetical protein